MCFCQKSGFTASQADDRRGKSRFAIESIDDRYCPAARRYAVAADATFPALRRRIGIAPFPAAIKTICIGNWKSSSSAAINSGHDVRIIAASR
jgi:hypothetical protein